MNHNLIVCQYCHKPTKKEDIVVIENLNLCKFCLENKKRPVNYLKSKKILSKENKFLNKKNNSVNFDTEIDNDNDYYYQQEKHDEDTYDLYSEEDNEVENAVYDDTLDRDALEFNDPDDYYRNDDYDNETLWYDKDDIYDEGWRR